MPSIVEAYTAKYEDDEDIGLYYGAHFKLQNLILDNSGIDCIGSNEKLKDICSNIKECDLSHNKLYQWKDVYSLLGEAPTIKFLNMSHNPLGSVASLPSPSHHLKVLILCNTGVEWSSLVALLQFLPSLKELNIGHNNLSTLECDITPANLPSLEHLNLIHNKIASFTDVIHISVLFDKLKALVLSDNPLVSFGDTKEAVEQFACLEQLYVNNIIVSSWDEVSKLRWFPTLNDVRMVHWDLFDDMPELDRRNMLAALLPTIKLINGAPIEERDAAERWYLRRCQTQGNTTGTRFKELHDKHGVLPELQDIDLGYGLDETVTVNVIIEDRAINTKKTFSIYERFGYVKDSISSEYNIKNCRLGIRKLNPNSLPSTRRKLWYQYHVKRDEGGTEVLTETSYLSASMLYTYPIETGDTFLLVDIMGHNRSLKQTVGLKH